MVVPVLLGLQERGFGESKGIATLVIAASSMDDVLAISIYGICLSMIFHTGSKFLRGSCSSNVIHSKFYYSKLLGTEIKMLEFVPLYNLFFIL